MSIVYFLRVGDDGPVKIGFTSHSEPSKRIGELQAGCPWPLNLIGFVAGRKPHENWLHEKLLAHRMTNEWFEPAPLVIETVGQVLSPSFSWSDACLSPLDLAISLAGSQCHLEHAIGGGGAAISIARKRGMGPRLRGRVEAYLRERSAA